MRTMLVKNKAIHRLTYYSSCRYFASS